MDWVQSVFTGQGTVVGVVTLLAAFTVFAFSRGWIMTASQTKTLLQMAVSRGDEWKSAYDKQTEALEAALGQIATLKVVGEAAGKVMHNLPPIEGQEEEAGTR